LGGQTAVGLQAVVQPDLPRGRQPDRLVGDALHFGIDQGPVALMIENYRSGLSGRHAPLPLHVAGAATPRYGRWL